MTHATITMRLDADNPWPGLESYCEDAQGFFYGRVHECQKLRRRFSTHPSRSCSVAQAWVRRRCSTRACSRCCATKSIRRSMSGSTSSQARRHSAASSTEAVRNAMLGRSARCSASRDDESLWGTPASAPTSSCGAHGTHLLTLATLLDQLEELVALRRGEYPTRVEAFKYDLADPAENRIPADLAARTGKTVTLLRRVD